MVLSGTAYHHCRSFPCQQVLAPKYRHWNCRGCTSNDLQNYGLCAHLCNNRLVNTILLTFGQRQRSEHTVSFYFFPFSYVGPISISTWVFLGWAVSRICRMVFHCMRCKTHHQLWRRATTGRKEKSYILTINWVWSWSRAIHCTQARILAFCVILQ